MKYTVGSSWFVCRPRAKPIRVTILRENKKSISVKLADGRKARISKTGLEQGGMVLKKKLPCSQPKKKKTAKKTKTSKAKAKAVSVFVQTKNGYRYMKFPASVIPRGFISESEAKRRRIELDDSSYQWSHFSHGNRTYLGRFVFNE